MPLIQESYDSLPYVDAEPTAAQRASAQALIDAELSPSASTTHEFLPPPPTSTLTPLLTSEFSRVEAKQPISGIDLARYEALDPPATTPHSDRNDPSTLALWRTTLSTAYISQQYLSGRQKHLNELNESGKEEWLAGNEELVGILGALEKELAETKERIDGTVVERQRAQQGVEGELKVLEAGWKVGVGRVLETELAAEDLRRRILDARRSGAV